jgi:hypothetical protein
MSYFPRHFESEIRKLQLRHGLSEREEWSCGRNTVVFCTHFEGHLEIVR